MAGGRLPWGSLAKMRAAQHQHRRVGLTWQEMHSLFFRGCLASGRSNHQISCQNKLSVTFTSTSVKCYACSHRSLRRNERPRDRRGQTFLGPKHPVKTLLAITALIEAGTGVALAVAPSSVAGVLLGSPREGRGSAIIARILGAALFALGAACWIARNDAQNKVAAGVVAAMLLYNAAVATLLGYAGLGLGMSGIGLWPAVILHAALSVWCIWCLRRFVRSSIV
jgi:hypothetical protein